MTRGRKAGRNISDEIRARDLADPENLVPGIVLAAELGCSPALVSAVRCKRPDPAFLGRPETPGAPVIVRLPKPLDRWVRARAGQLGVKARDLVLRAVERYRESEGADANGRGNQ